MESGPLVSRSGPLTGQHVPTRVQRRRGGSATARYLTSTDEPCHLPPTGHVQLSRHPYLYLVTTSTKRRAISPVASNSLVPLLCSALNCWSPLCSPWPATTEPPPCHPTGPKRVPWHCAPIALSASWITAYRSRAADVSASPTTSSRSLSMTTAIRAPLAALPLQEGPLESIVWPHLNLHRRWPRSKPKPSSSFPSRWAPPVDSPHQPSSGPADPSNSFDQFPEHLDPITGPAPSFSRRPSTTAVETPLSWAQWRGDWIPCFALRLQRRDWVRPLRTD
jgi:hypothetical protein